MDTPPRRKDYPQIEWTPLPEHYIPFIIMTLIYRHTYSRVSAVPLSLLPELQGREGL
jgi:hypothetical protein